MNKKIINFLALAVSDFLAVFSSFLLALFLRIKILPLIDSALLEKHVLVRNYLNYVFVVGVWFLVFLYEKLYTRRYSFLDEVRILLKSTSISFAFVMIMIFITRQQVRFSRLIIVLAWIFSFFLLPLFRLLTKSFLIQLNLWKKKVIILNASSGDSSLIEALRENKTLGYEIVGFLTEKKVEAGQRLFDIEVLGEISELEKWQGKTGFEDIIINLPDMDSNKLIELLKQCEQVSETIRYIPPTGALISAGVEIENIGRILCLAVRKNLAKPWNVFLKNFDEYILAALFFILLSPLFFLIALAIKLDSRGPIFYIQERYAKKGKKIKLLKFRSMHMDAESRLKDYLAGNPEAQTEWEEYKKIRKSDPRVTRLGRILRKYSLDELPQLLNILKGEMSLVGPRPYLAEELEEVRALRPLLFQVKPGITGLWQISGRSLLPFSERLNLDEYYIRNWSLWLDIVILMKTFKIAASGTGAF